MMILKKAESWEKLKKNLRLKKNTLKRRKITISKNQSSFQS